MPADWKGDLPPLSDMERSDRIILARLIVLETALAEIATGLGNISVLALNSYDGGDPSVTLSEVCLALQNLSRRVQDTLYRK